MFEELFEYITVHETDTEKKKKILSQSIYRIPFAFTRKNPIGI